MAEVHGLDQVKANLGKFASNFDQAALAGARSYAATVENAMKANAPWTDRTSAARNSLQAAAGKQGQDLVVVASGGMTYSPFLETRYAGKYAIILKTLQSTAPQFLDHVTRAVKALGT
jgi:hypothetical protein